MLQNMLHVLIYDQLCNIIQSIIKYPVFSWWLLPALCLHYEERLKATETKNGTFQSRWTSQADQIYVLSFLYHCHCDTWRWSIHFLVTFIWKSILRRSWLCGKWLNKLFYPVFPDYFQSLLVSKNLLPGYVVVDHNLSLIFIVLHMAT